MNHTAAKAAIAKARNEIAEENMNKSVKQLKELLRQERATEVILANIRREITDLEEAIEQGNN